MFSHPLVDKWAQKKYNKPEGTKFFIQQETLSSGYCETCYSEYEAIVVYESINGKMTQLDDFRMEFSEILNEILNSV